MKCPACKSEMVEQDFKDVVVDVCKDGCKGIWFDWHELAKLDEKNEGLGQALQEALQHVRANDENRGQINCPKCSIPMHIHKYVSAKEINVDECYACGGFFLDSGELREIRDNFMSEQECKQYCDKLLGGNPICAKGTQDALKDKQRAEALVSYTKFIRLSYYATGK